MRYIVVLRGTNVIGAKDSAFILLRLRRNSPGLTVRETTLKDGDFPLRPSRSRELKVSHVEKMEYVGRRPKLNSRFPGLLILDSALRLAIDRRICLILPGLGWIMFARAFDWHPLGTLLLAHRTLHLLQSHLFIEPLPQI